MHLPNDENLARGVPSRIIQLPGRDVVQETHPRLVAMEMATSYPQGRIECTFIGQTQTYHASRSH